MLGLAVVVTGCSRKHYRTHADQDVAKIYAEKRREEAYTLPPLPGIAIDPRSRFFDPSPEDCPALPPPEPTLFAYRLPELQTGDPTLPPPAQNVPSEIDPEEIPADVPSLDLPPPLPDPAEPSMELIEPQVEPQIGTVSMTEMIFAEGGMPAGSRLPLSVVSKRVKLAHLIRDTDDSKTGATAEADATTEADSGQVDADLSSVGEDSEASNGLQIVPIPPEYWAQIPETCLPRMLEFEYVKTEFRRSFPDATPETVAGLLSDAPRLSLPMITELSSFNSRELQTAKERLYQVALALTAQRYEYVLRPTRRGNGAALVYTHTRFGGVAENGLSIPTEVAVAQTTATAGQFLASFANSVVLTFNGPQGFAADIGSDLIFDFQQTIFQRDAVFENLTQAERNVVYAARDLIRFQRSLFVDLATRYYGLLLAYREIEISSQDYFSNLRAFLQGRAEHLKAGRIPRIQVDQFEQNALRTRSSLVRDCNNLETLLDRLKLVIGLPTEMPLNLDLTELESLSTSDELTVTRQLVIRTRQTLLDASQGGLGDRDAAVNGANVLIKRIVDSLRVRSDIQGIEEETEAERDAKRLERKLALLEARLQADKLDSILKKELSSKVAVAPLLQFWHRADLIDAQLVLARRAMAYQENEFDAETQSAATKQMGQFNAQLDDLQARWDSVDGNQQADRQSELIKEADGLLEQANGLAARFVGRFLPLSDGQLENVIVTTVDETVAMADRVETSEVGGLGQVDVADDEAMMLALYQRLDVMNERGEFADARRQIKLAADDLKSILDFRATHTLRGRDRFDLWANGSIPRLSLALDTPLNRRLERNAYRVSLINYNAARRALIEREDGIKFQVREDLRQLRLRRNQYEISVASAALAYERVVSTRLQLQLAVGNVVARDFLEAQQAYTDALNSVATDHISFILDRIGLFFDTESLLLDENGFWSAGQDESLELPQIPNFYDANPNPYGRLPPCLHYSDEVRRNH